MQHKSVPADPAKDLPPTPASGLTDEEADRRRKAGLGNITHHEPGKSVGRIILENLLTPFNLLNFFLAGCLVAVQSYRNMLFLGVVISNTLIGTIQELRAKHTLEHLQLLNAPRAHVLRGGISRSCPATDLVQGDLCTLHAGDEVPADAVITAGFGTVDESLLTGESEPVSRIPGDELPAGSHITEGQFTICLTRVGDHSSAARLTASARRIRQRPSKMMTELNRLIRMISMALLPLGALLMLKQTFILHTEPAVSVPTVVAAMIGMIPEGLILLTSIALTVGVIRLGRKQTLVQEMYSIESLARVDILCTDKTGTLTSGKMKLETLFPLDCDVQELGSSLKRFLGAFDPVSPTLRALCERVGRGSEKAARVVPFSSGRKCSAAVFADGQALVLGAPQFVSLPGDAAGRIESILQLETQKGHRVLVLTEGKAGTNGSDMPQTEKLLGLIAISDVLRPHAAETLRYFADQGITVKILSGDDPRTVSVLASRLGLENAERYVDASACTNEELTVQAERCSIFGRVTPKQKKLLVETLQSGGHTVGMTGDGINDISSLKAADCSIAMGSGTDAARRVAQMSLLNDDFSSVPDILLEGRRVIGNITRTSTLFLVKTLYSLALSVLMLLLPLHYPFQPIQLSLISSLAIGIPGFFLAMEPDTRIMRGDFLRTVLRKAVPGAAAVAFCCVCAMLCERFGLEHAHCSTLAVLSTGILQLTVLGTVCMPFTRLRCIVLVAMCLAFASAVYLFEPLFFLTARSLPLSGWLILSGMVLAGGAVLYGITKWLKSRPL